MQGAGENLSGPSYKKYAAALQDLLKLRDEQHTLRSTLVVLEQQLTHLLVTTGVVATSNPAFVQLASAIVNIKSKMEDIVR